MSGQGGRKRAKVKNPTAYVPVETVKQIWNQIDVPDWMHLLRSVHPTNRWTSSHRTIKGRCPFHQDKDPSFVIHLTRRYAKCFSPQCGKYFYDPIRFYQELQAVPLSYVAALKELKTRYNIKISHANIKGLTAQHNHFEMKRILHAVMNGELCDALTLLRKDPPPPELTYVQSALHYLDYRNIPNNYHHCPIGVLPGEHRLRQLLTQYAQLHKTDDFGDAAVKYLGDVLEGTHWIGSLAFFSGMSPTDPCKIKLRRIPQRIKGKYVAAKDTRFVTDTTVPHNGVFGLYGTPIYHPLYRNDEMRSFLLMEGEFDALTLFSNQFHTGQVNFFAFSGGGSSTVGLDALKPFGFDRGYIVGDCDDGGEAFVKTVLEGTAKLGARVFVWPTVLRQPDTLTATVPEKTDPDDAVKRCGMAVVEKELRREDNYMLPHTWAASYAAKEMHALASDDVRCLTNTAADWGRFVRDSAEQQAYVGEIVKQFPIVNQGEVINAIRTGDEYEDAFIERLKNVLATRLHILRLQVEKHQNTLECWDTETGQVVKLPIADVKGIRSNLEMIFRKDILQFIIEDVGEPGFMAKYSENKSAAVYQQYSNAYLTYLDKAVSRLTSLLPRTSQIRYAGAGLHCVAPHIDPLAKEDDFRLYFVNGPKMYRGDFEAEDRLIWQELPGPADEHVVVWMSGLDSRALPRVVCPQILSAADLNKEPKYTPLEMFNILREMLHYGWDFQNHKVMTEYLAGLCMALCMADAIPMLPMIMFTANQSSGKSSLLGGFIGRVKGPRINVVQHALFMDNYTAAGVRQSMNYSHLALCLDEFEDKGTNDRSSVQARMLQQEFRGMVHESVTTVYGTASGHHQEYVARYPVCLAGIRTPRDAADISRYLMIEMDKKGERRAPQDILLERYGEQKIVEIRHELTLIAFRLARKVYRCFHEVQDEFSDGGGLEFGGVSRSRINHYAVWAVMKACGFDYKQHAKNFFHATRSDLERISQISLSSDLIDTILHTPAIDTQDIDDTRPKMLSTVLASADPGQLNHTNSGFYYDAQNQWLLVRWTTVQATVMQRTPSAFRGESPERLKQQSRRSSYHIPDEIARTSGVLERLKPYIGTHANWRDISVFNVPALDSDMQAGYQEYVKGSREWTAQHIGVQPEDFGLDTVTFPTAPAPKGKQATESTPALKVVQPGEGIDGDDFDY